MRGRGKIWVRVAVATAAVAALGVFSGTASAATIVVNPGDANDLCNQLAAASPGDVLVVSGTYFTDSMGGCGTAANGFEVPDGVTVTGVLGGKKTPTCVSNLNAIIDGDASPTLPAGHTGPGFNIEGAGVTIQCLTVRFGTTGITNVGQAAANDSDGLIVNNVQFRGNDRNRSINGGSDDPQSSGVYMEDANNVTVMNSYFTGQGSFGVFSQISTVTNNDAWQVLGNTFDQIGTSCVVFNDNSNSFIGKGVLSKGSWKVSQGNTCKLTGRGAAFTVYGNGVVLTPNIVAGNKVNSAFGDCIYLNSDGTVAVGNTCNLSQNGYLVDSEGTGDMILNNKFGAGYSGIYLANPGTVDGNSIAKTADASVADTDAAIEALGAGTVVQNNSIGVSNNRCVGTDGIGAQVKKNQCGAALSASGILVTGDNSQVKKNKLGSNYGDCVEANVADPTIAENTCVQSETGYGYEFTGSGTATVTGNSVTNSYSAGFLILNGGAAGQNLILNSNSVGATLNDNCYSLNIKALSATNNNAGNCYTNGFSVTAYNFVFVAAVGSSPAWGIFNGNKVTNTHFGEGIFVECDNTCTQGQVNSNTIDESTQGDTYVGLHVYNNGAGPCDAVNCAFVVNKNTIKHSGNSGIWLAGNGFSLSGNTIQNAGTIDAVDGATTDYGLFVDGNHNTVTKTTVTNSFDDGIHITGDANALNAQTKVSNNGEDGINVESGTGNSVSNNSITNNDGEGLENNATSTVLSNNTMSGNRQDCAGTGSTSPVGVSATPGLGGNVCNDGTDFNDVGPIVRPTRK